LDIARVCRAFAEPALTALYRCPPLVPSLKAHRLAKLLRTPVDELSFGYKNKVQRLEIDVVRTLYYSTPVWGNFELHKLLAEIPRVEHIELFHPDDRPPYQKLNTNSKWKYPAYLTDVLMEAGIRLRTWRWSGRLGGDKFAARMLKTVHGTLAFSRLEKVSFVNYRRPMKKREKLEEGPLHLHLAEAICALPNLKHLVFESCDFINDELLFRLPRNLASLEFINCWDLNAEDLANFLVTHGNKLKELALHHNQSLSLEFLPELAESCPNLEVLQMNLTYFNPQFSYRDSDPHFADLLQLTDVPKWPGSLRVGSRFSLSDHGSVHHTELRVASPSTR
jgi:hypothetical protein